MNINIGSFFKLKEESVFKKTPKWLFYIFKIYGTFILVFVVIASFYIVVSLTAVIRGGFFVPMLMSFLPTVGVTISSAIIGYGCYKLKRWVIPILALSIIGGIIKLLTDFSVSQILAFVFTIILFFLAYFYRQNFTGSYKAYLVYIIYGVSLVLTLSGFFIIPNAQISFNNESDDLDQVIYDSVDQVFDSAVDTTSAKSRNYIRMSNMRNIMIAQEIYYAQDEHYKYAPTLDLLVKSGFLDNEMLKDPLTGKDYDYCLTQDLLDFTIGTQLEVHQGSEIMMNSSEIMMDEASCLLLKTCGENEYFCLTP